MSNSQRLRRISDLIQRNLALHLKKEVNDPRLANIAITRVDVSPDIKQAKIYFSLVNTTEMPAATSALQKANSYLRTLLAHSCGLRYTPRLIFIYDDSIERAERIDQLLDKIPPSLFETEEE